MKRFTRSQAITEKKRCYFSLSKSLNYAKSFGLRWDLSSNTIARGWKEKSNTSRQNTPEIHLKRTSAWNWQDPLQCSEVAKGVSAINACLGYGFAFCPHWTSKVGVNCKIFYHCFFNSYFLACLRELVSLDTFQTVAKCDNSYTHFADTRKETVEVEMSMRQNHFSKTEKRLGTGSNCQSLFKHLIKRLDYSMSVNLPNCSIRTDKKPGYLIKLHLQFIQTEFALRVTHCQHT